MEREKRVFRSSTNILLAIFFSYFSRSLFVLSALLMVDVSFSFVAYLKFQTPKKQGRKWWLLKRLFVLNQCLTEIWWPGIIIVIIIIMFVCIELQLLLLLPPPIPPLRTSHPFFFSLLFVSVNTAIWWMNNRLNLTKGTCICVRVCVYAYRSLRSYRKNSTVFYNKNACVFAVSFFLLLVGLCLLSSLLCTGTHTHASAVDRVFILSYRMLRSFPSRHHKCFIVSVNWNSPCALISNDLNYSDTCSSVCACIFSSALSLDNSCLLLVSFWVHSLGVQKTIQTNKNNNSSPTNQRTTKNWEKCVEHAVMLTDMTWEVRGVSMHRNYSHICHISNIPLELTIYANEARPRETSREGKAALSLCFIASS